MTYPPARLAGLLLRWSAQLVANETPELLIACTEPLHDAGYDLAALETTARALADAARRAIAGHEERRAA
jgi:hypothetical protein